MLLAGGIAALLSTHHSGQETLPPGKYLVNRKIAEQDGTLYMLANVQTSSNGLATFNITETNETSAANAMKCTSPPPPLSDIAVRLSSGQVDDAVATMCTDNPTWQISLGPGQTIVYYVRFRNNPGLAQPFTFKVAGLPAVSGIRLS